jgi:hypothetical protein
MKPFNPDATCPKCGHDEISSLHVPERNRGHIYSTEQDQERAEHIRRRCQRCHYSWNEATLDREEGK